LFSDSRVGFEYEHEHEKNRYRMKQRTTMPTPTRKRASIHTLGCRLNQAESVLLAEKLAAAGFDLVPFGEPADVGIIHTCTVTREADAKSRKLIRQFVRANPHAQTAVIGCYAQMNAAALAELGGVDLIIGNQRKLDLLGFLGEDKRDQPLVVQDRFDRQDFRIEAACVSPLRREFAQRANLKIQDGCDFMCSFCIIPFARGRVRSRELDDLMDEARALANAGAKELVLTGINLGTYAHRGQNVLDVVHRLNEIPGVARIRIGSIEPTTIPEGLFEAMNDPGHALVPYLHIPMQSGSNRVLERMRRRYTREEYLDFVEQAQARVPGIGIGGDIMVGFPGETGEDFEDTVDVLRRSPLFYAHVFKYSERPGTPAARMADPVDPNTANLRSARLRRLGAVKRRRFHERHLGRTVEVLFEEQEDGLWTGYTGNYIRVGTSSRRDLTNQLVPVTLESTQGERMLGRLAAAPEPEQRPE
jgi:threonylcarbamoyladenosine tRNA methylthiotransferase MtaB